MLRLRSTMLAAALLGTATLTHAQDDKASWTFDTYTPGVCSANGGKHGGCPAGDLVKIHVVTVVHGLVRPWHLTFLPGTNDYLVTELPGDLRIVRGGKLDPQPIPGWPTDKLRARSMNSVVLHPDFARSRLLYVSYVKQRDGGDTTIALARGRFDGTKLDSVEDVFVADAWGTGATAGRAEVGPDRMIYLTVGDRDAGNLTDDASFRMLAQNLGSHVGKVLRLRDDGTAPPDNPFVGRAGAKPEIYTYGHRNAQGLAWHPETGELWATEIGPMGGDEINILRAGSNYGWPLVSLGKLYSRRDEVSEQHWYREGMEMPFMFWTPSISPNSLVWYTGDKLPPWRGSLFVGALNGQTLQRVAFDQPAPQSERRDSLFISLGRRWRHVVQSPDGYLYAVTEKRTLGTPPDPNDATSGVVYRIEPAH